MTPPNPQTARKEKDVSTAAPLTSEKPSGPRSRKGVETRARLVSAAKEVFERDGFLDARISDIAERAGLSHGSFYHYFESKEEVFREVAAEVDERLSAPLTVSSSTRRRPPPPTSGSTRPSASTWRATATKPGSWVSSSRCGVSTHSSTPYAPSGTAATPRRSPTPFVACNAMGWRTGVSTRRSPPTALGAMTYRFPEMWFVQGLLDCDFDEGVDQLTRLFVNALGIPDLPEHEA